MRRESLVSKIFTIFIPLTLILIFVLFPFYWTFKTSITPSVDLFTKGVQYWPDSITFDSYVRLFKTTVKFGSAMKNSLIVALLTVAISLTVSTMAAYSFSRFRYKGRGFFMSLFLCNNMFPTVLLLIPLYAIMRKMNLLYTPWALVLAYTTFTIPFSVLLLKGFIDDTPMALEEAALIDGCSRSQAFFRIMMPILGPCIMSTGIYIFMQSWNEYTFAMLFTNNEGRTIPVALKSLIGQVGVEWDLLTAGGIITIIPVCIMFFFAQKRLVEGLTAGAVKG